MLIGDSLCSGRYMIPEVAQLMLYFWAYNPREQHNISFYLLSADMLNAVKEYEHDIAPTYTAVMSGIADAQRLLYACTKARRIPTLVDQPLFRVMTAAYDATNYCPIPTYQKIQGPFARVDPWVITLRNVVRACERAICMGTDTSLFDTIVRFGVGII